MILKNKNYIALSSSVFVSNVGNGLNNIILGKVLYDKTGNIYSFGIMFVVEHLFNLLLGAWSGFFVDRNNSRGICIFSDFSRGGIIILTTMVYFYSDNYIWIIIGVLFNNLIKPFNRAAAFSLPVELFSLDNLFKFNVWMNIALQSGYLIGASLVYPLLKYGGTYFAFYINGISYLLSAFFISQTFLIREAKSVEKLASNEKIISLFFKEWLHILNFLRGSREVVLLALLSSVGFLVITIFNLLLVPIVEKNFNSDQRWLSYLEVIFALGTIASGYLIKFKLDFKKFLIFNLASCVCILFWFVLLKYNANQFLISTFVFIIALLLSIHISSAFTLIQQKVLIEKLGKFSTVKRNIHSLIITVTVLILTSGSRLTALSPIDLSIVLFLIIIAFSIYILYKVDHYVSSPH